MTKEECSKRIEEIAESIKLSLIIKAKQLYSCGGIDPEEYPDGYVLPRILVVAASKEVISNYTFAPDKKEIENLSAF